MKRIFSLITVAAMLICSATSMVYADETTGLVVDTAQIQKYYFSDEIEFDKMGIVVTCNGEDVTEEAEITFMKTPEIFDGENFDYEIGFNVWYGINGGELFHENFSTDVHIGIHGDVDRNNKIELYDTIAIAKRIMNGSSKVDGTFADFMYNVEQKDNVIDLYDAIWSAKLCLELNLFPEEPEEEPTEEPQEPIEEPDITDYNVNTMSGIRSYANDYIVYQSSLYGIPEEHIYFDDTVDEWSGYSWDVPSVFISDLDYYMEQSGGYQPIFYQTTAETLVGSVVDRIDSAVREWKYNGDTDEDVKTWGNFTIKWEHLGHDNYKSICDVGRRRNKRLKGVFLDSLFYSPMANLFCDYEIDENFQAVFTSNPKNVID